MVKRVLFVVTNHGDLGNTGKKTGWYLPEVAHPYYVFKEAGFEIVFVSPKGGLAPMDPGSKKLYEKDPVCMKFLSSENLKELETTKKPSELNPRDFQVIFYAGGHGPMYDLADNQDVANLCRDVYENNGIVSAVCHGTVGLLEVKLTNAERLIKDQTVTSFTDAEEGAVGLTAVMPFLLEKALKEKGAKFKSCDNFQPNVQVSGRIITGQNPDSATPLAKKIVDIVNSK